MFDVMSYLDGKRYIIDQGDEGQHPTREGEECEFWSPDND